MHGGSTGRGFLSQAFRSFLVALLALGTPGAGFGLAASEPTMPAQPGAAALSIASDPQGAAVYLNGQLQGATPLTVSRMAPGEHRVRLVKDGYLENSRVVTMKADQPGTVQVRMTPDRDGARYTVQQEPGEGGGGGSKKALWIGLGVVAAGAGAYFLLRDTNDPPTASVRIDAGGTALQGATSVSFDAGGSSDPNGDSLTYSWNFGDNATGSGQSASHVYASAGTFNVTLTVNDGKASATATATVNVRNLTGVWIGNIGGPEFFSFNLTHTGSSITGTYADTVNGTGPATGNVSSPRGVTLRNAVPGFRVGNWTGTADADVNRVTGSVDWFTGGARTFTLRRQ